ncbi:uncharacterized protein LOC124459988 [Drosophila willistoni]|uniref:uncharacterized protein LOC124459988 n=1 Tax=Drosophila willistoni TaxID=7260 RepID=UPI001F07F2F9|nr:uncharacterized protein LOC124459988 [Drosophila willistoni]
MNTKQLNIVSVGGNGSPGQNGGNGFYGSNPDTREPVYCFMERGNDKCGKKSTDTGKNGTNGGDGGIGGKPGNFGEIDVVGLIETPVINIRREQGVVGASGKGGQGGNATENVSITYQATHFPVYNVGSSTSCCRYVVKNSVATIQFSNGIDGYNKRNMKETKTLNFSNKCEIINRFISFARESILISPLMREHLINLSNSFMESDKIKRFKNCRRNSNNFHTVRCGSINRFTNGRIPFSAKYK